MRSFWEQTLIILTLGHIVLLVTFERAFDRAKAATGAEQVLAEKGQPGRRGLSANWRQTQRTLKSKTKRAQQ